MIDEVDFTTSCNYSRNVLYCNIESEIEGLEFAFYVEVNGIQKKKFWYSLVNSIEYDCEDEIVHEYRITYFIREKNGKITTSILHKKTNWAICEGVSETIRLLVNKSSNLLELGSGKGSESLANHCSVQCIEHDSRFLNLFSSITYIHAPLSKIDPLPEFNEKVWYDFTKIEKELKTQYDIILVDGPPAEFGRSGILLHLDKLDLAKVWIIDDVLRAKDQLIANYIALELKMIQYRFWNFSILSQKPISSSILDKIHTAANKCLSNESKEYILQYYPSHNIDDSIQT